MKKQIALSVSMMVLGLGFAAYHGYGRLWSVPGAASRSPAAGLYSPDGDEGGTEVPIIREDGRHTMDHIDMSASETYRDLIEHPPGYSTFEQDIDAIANGKRPLVQADCTCRYTEHDGGQIHTIDEHMMSYGATQEIATAHAKKGCFEDAITAETHSFEKSHKRRALDFEHETVDQLWGMIGHVQTVSVSSCTYSKFKFDVAFLQKYAQSHSKAVASAADLVHGLRDGTGQSCLGPRFPNWARTLIAALNGGWSWRARGGAIPTGNDNLARIGFAFVPMVLTACIASHDMREFKDGIIMAALMTAPLYVFTYSHEQGAGEGNISRDNNGFFGPVAPVTDSRTGAIIGDTFGMSEYGYALGNFAAMLYAKARCYDPSYLAVAGLARGACYLGGSVGGTIKSPTLGAVANKGGSERGETCTGAVTHVGLALTLEKGPVCNTEFTGIGDAFKPANLRQFAIDARDTGLVPSAVYQSMPFCTPEVRLQYADTGCPPQ